MNKYAKIITIVAIGSVLLQSCGDFLDTSPTTGVDNNKAITNEENATAALIGTYSGFTHYNYYGRDFVVQGDVPTNNTAQSATNSNRFVTEFSWTITKSESDVKDFWNKAYNTINRANEIIVANISGDETIINSIKGEAYALRALAHFDLVRFFAQNYNFTADHSHLGVPYVFVHNPANKPGRNTVGEVYTYIINDLKKAQELGVNKFSRKQPPFTLSDGAVNALLAKVYLYMGDYTNAKNCADLVIPKYTLVPHDNYIASWLDESSSESIFTIAQTKTGYAGTNALGYILNGDGGYGDILTNETLYKLYADNDVRKGWYEYGTKSTTKNNVYATGKYPGRGGIIGLDNFNVIRLSEIYLIAAEAAARLNDATAAQGYLNVVRQRSIPTAPAITLIGQDLIDDILLEKRKELAFEGNYYHDLKRLQSDVTGAYINKPEATVITYPNNLFAWPIPESEINANQNIKNQQNPGY